MNIRTDKDFDDFLFEDIKTMPPVESTLDAVFQNDEMTIEYFLVKR